jgi:hypothetical protein
MAMVPHERSLVKRMEGKPFALLGVDCDNDVEAARQVTINQHLNWRSWWDGDGRIRAGWQVEYLPTLYVIDAKGIIRFTAQDYFNDPRAATAKLDKLIEDLAREAQSAGRTS